MHTLINTRRLQHIIGGLVCALSYVTVFGADYSGTCPNGAPAREARYCRFFVKHNNDATTQLDTRIADALRVKSASETRSIGFIIAIDKYPNLPDHNISAAGVDGERLKDFLINKQKFDEVIILRNEDATTENINYFLQDYLPNRALNFQHNGENKGRLLIAYSGHGRYGKSNGTTSTQAAFVLSAANDLNGSANMYKMQSFAMDVEALAGKYFHVLTLVNACYGGGFFTNGAPGGNADGFRMPGSYALTAGSDNDIVPALSPKRGSLFFDLVIQGINQGTADPLYWDSYNTVGLDGKNELRSGLTRTGALNTYLTSSYDRIERKRPKSASNFTLSVPWLGPAQQGVAKGGFFFLSDHSGGSSMASADDYARQSTASADSAGSVQKFGVQNVGPDPAKAGSQVGASDNPSVAPAKPQSENATPTRQLTLPIGPVSSIAGRPDIKIFKAPDVYPIFGYDFSSADGKIDWNAFANEPRPRFIYARAVGWSGPDIKFNERWTNIKALNIDYGAYIKYDFCKSSENQIAIIAKIVPIDSGALPMAIEIVDPNGEDNRQLKCFNAMGLKRAKNEVLELASKVQSRYGKVPLLYGNRNNLSTFIDQRSDKFMIWLGSYGVSGIRLRGRNPWTLWQYSGTLNVKGVGPKTTGEVFFGTEEQYKLFKTGQLNVALNAVN